ncbi:hypothetical protein PSPO01_15050 [Paraphaeosphaeria sporulosa]
MSEADLRQQAEERFARRRANMREPLHERLTSENLAWRVWNNSVTTVAQEDRRAPLTAANLCQHEAEMHEPDRPVLSAADLARRNAAGIDQEVPQLMCKDFDYSNTGWRRAGHREGRGGLLEPRAGARRR